MSSRKIRYRKSDGTIATEKFSFNKNKKYKFNKSTGAVEEVALDAVIAEDEITIPGSKSSLRRIADLERNVSILASKSGVTGQSNSDTDVLLKSGNQVLDGTLHADGFYLEDQNSTVDSLFGIYGWDSQLQFTARNLSTNAHLKTILSLDYSTYKGIFSNDLSVGGGFSASGYSEIGNGVGSVSNTGNWHGRLNVAGTSHARIDVTDLSDGVTTTMYSHTGQGVGKVGTMSDHPVHLMQNGVSAVEITTAALSGPTSITKISDDAIQFGGANSGYETNSAQISAGYHQTDTLCIVGMGTTGTNRKIRAWAEGGFTINGSLTASGDVTAYSDDRLKTNVQTIDGALDRVSAVRGVTYDRITDGSTSVGVIAQELEAVLPEAVHMDAEGVRHVAYGNISGLLIEAVKELRDIVEAQAAEIQSLKNM